MWESLTVGKRGWPKKVSEGHLILLDESGRPVGGYDAYWITEDRFIKQSVRMDFREDRIQVFALHRNSAEDWIVIPFSEIEKVVRKQKRFGKDSIFLTLRTTWGAPVITLKVKRSIELYEALKRAKARYDECE